MLICYILEIPLDTYKFNSGYVKPWINPSDQVFEIIERWTVNISTAKCFKFIYYGAGGHYNNFKSKDECENHCILYLL